eukprot:1311863-Amorphochlora_amoeboformis.AAC.2
MEKVSVMVARGSRKRTNMVIDFGSSPAKKKVEEALVLPALEDEKWTGEHMNEDLDDKVFGLANRADTGGNKSSRVLLIACEYARELSPVFVRTATPSLSVAQDLWGLRN